MRRHRHCRRRHRRCRRLPDSGESPPGAPRPASAHVIPGPPLPPPLAREAASSAQPSPGAATWLAPCWGARGFLSLGLPRGCGRPPRGALLPNARRGPGGVPVTGREPHCADCRGCAPEALPGRPRPPAFAGALEHLPPAFTTAPAGAGVGRLGLSAVRLAPPPAPGSNSDAGADGAPTDTHRSQAGAALAPSSTRFPNGARAPRAVAEGCWVPGAA